MSCEITGLGMLTSVGHSAPMACAAIRAGISRPRDLQSFTTLDEIGGPAALVAHPVHGRTEGFHALGRWIRLAVGALDDLRSRSALPGNEDRNFWQETLLCVVVPEPEERFLSREPMDPERLTRSYVDPVRELAGLPIPSGSIHLVRCAEAGAIEALSFVQAKIEANQASRAIVVAVDSLIEPHCLARLSGAGRLKVADQPTGLAPGEAGAALLLQSAVGSPDSSPSNTVWLRSAVLGKEAAFEFDRNTSRGEELSSVIATALRSASCDVPFAGDWITNFNGEIGAASELGATIQRLTPHTLSPAVQILHPCSEVGDTGAAAPAIAVAMAVYSHQRGYSRGGLTLVTARADDGTVGAAVIGPSLAAAG